MFNKFFQSLAEKNTCAQFDERMNCLSYHISSYVISKWIEYPYIKYKDGTLLNEYDALLVNLDKQIHKIRKIHDMQAILFFNNELFHELFLIDKVNDALYKHVPMEHEDIRVTMRMIFEGQKKTLERYYELNTASLKDELKISIALRKKEEEIREELLKQEHRL